MVVYRGWQGKVMRGTSHTDLASGRFHPSYVEAEIQNWSIEVDNSAESHHFLGSRTATDITVGPKRVTGNFSKMWFDNEWPQSFVDTDLKADSWVFKGWCDYGGDISVVAYGAMLTRWRASGEGEGPHVQDVDFIAKNLNT